MRLLAIHSVFLGDRLIIDMVMVGMVDISITFTPVTEFWFELSIDTWSLESKTRAILIMMNTFWGPLLGFVPKVCI